MNHTLTGLVRGGTGDNARIIQAAIDQVGSSGGGTVFFPPGSDTYQLVIPAPGRSALTIRAHTLLVAPTGSQPTLLMAPGSPNYHAVIDHSGDVSGSGLSGLTIDCNSDHNPVVSLSQLVAGPRYVYLAVGKNILLDQVTVRGHCGRQAFFLAYAQIGTPSNNQITHCVFESIGNPYGFDFDSSTVYIGGTGGDKIAGCKFSARNWPHAGTHGARTAVEIHGPCLLDQCTMWGFYAGANLTGIARVNHLVTMQHCQIVDAAIGVYLWNESYHADGKIYAEPLIGCLVSNNTIILRRDLQATIHPGGRAYGIRTEPLGDLVYQHLTIENNHITFSPCSTPHPADEWKQAGITLNLNTDIGIHGPISVAGNSILGSPGPAIRYEIRSHDSRIINNQITLPLSGSTYATYADPYRSGITVLHPQTNLSISGNTVTDHTPARMKRPIYS